ncbi:MAG: type IV pilin protein [Gemmatimonadaceae bacterium]
MPRAPAHFDQSARLRPAPSGRSGFTLVEVTIVALVIGVLAAVAVPRYTGSKEKAYVAAMQADLHTAAVYEEQYALENHGQYFSGVATEDSPVEGFRATKGVTVTLTASDILGSHLSEWVAVARHAQSSESCEVRNGFIVCTTESDPSTGFFARN